MTRKLDWRDLVGMIILLAVLGLALMRLASGTYTIWTFAILGIVLVLLGRQVWILWPRKSRGGEESMVSIVMFLREHRYFDADMLRPIIERAWGVTLGTDEQAESFVVGEGRHFVIKAPAGIFAVHNVELPYVEDRSQMAAQVQEQRLAKAIEEHAAWTSVDLVLPLEPRDQGAPYRAIGRLVAELADDNCLLLYSPQLDRGVVYDEQLQAKLQGDDPLEAIRALIHVPVIGISSDDPRMKAAVEEARRRWPEFVQAFEQRDEDQMFSVKAPFGDEDEREYMWVNVSAIENDVIYGELGNDPVSVPSLKEGDRVRVRLEDVNDWLYSRGEELVGGFTMKVLRDQLG